LNSPKNILVCPLNWGIGHATRCVPIIRKLVLHNFNVIVAADKRSLAFLKQEFPDLEYIQFQGYDISYQKKGSLFLKMLKLTPRLLLSILKEHNKLKKIIKKHHIHAIISDNRFGLWNKKIYSIYITHQIHIKTSLKSKLLDLILFQIHKIFINRYDECWIPDYEGTLNFSGELSHRFTKPENAHFIGPLSRFEPIMHNHDNVSVSAKKYQFDLMVILSGPEPQRSILENIILKQLEETNLRSIIVQGITEYTKMDQKKDNILIYSHLLSKDLRKFMEQSKMILCRSGYSSIMDLSALNKDAIFIPTPGQTEQEYLATHFERKKCFFYMKQKEFDLIYALEQSANYLGFSMKYNPGLLNERINYFLDILEGIN